MKKLVFLLTIVGGTMLLSHHVRADCRYDISPTKNASHGQEKGNSLPVRFENLNATLEDNNVKITWSALTGKSNKQFEIQRSADGGAFKTIAIIFTLDEKSEMKDYTFSDKLKGVQEKKIKYRIKLVDVTEQYAFSDTVSPVQ